MRFNSCSAASMAATILCCSVNGGNGMVNDMYVESRIDEHKYAVVATQEDFDKF